MNKKRIISILLFLIGLSLILYPFISRTYYDVHSREETKQIVTDFVNDGQSEMIYKQQLIYNQSEISNLENIEVPDVNFVEEPILSDGDSIAGNTDSHNYLVNENIIGTISIPAINLFYPIYDGATYENLYNGVARVEGTSYPVGGLNTNSVIAGHNGLVGRIYFSYLNKLVSGDIIEIQNRKEKLRYEVYKTAVIEPNDSSALAVIPGQDTVTLLTCTWPAPGTHRYLVFTRRIPDEKSLATQEGRE